MTNHIQYPIHFKFRIGTFSNDFTATDNNHNTVAYVKQKLFKLKEKVIVFTDDSMSKEIYRIDADKWIDFNTAYQFTSCSDDASIGKVARKGWKSLWKAKYELFDEQDQPDLVIQEENPIAKVLDSLLGEIPILGMLTGYVFNPKYGITRPDGTLVARISKDKSFLGRKFTIDKLADFEDGEETRILLGSMMMLLLERRRG